MIIVNSKLDGEYAYDITVGEGAAYRVFAYNVETALNILADRLESDNRINAYLDNTTVELAAKCSKWLTAEAFAKAHNLVCCGTNHIYIPVISIKGCPNG